MTITITIENGRPQTHHLNGRVAEIAAWLVEQAEMILKSDKGQIQIDYFGADLVMRNTQITERRKKKH